MNSSKTTIERKGNTIVGSAKPMMRTRAFSIGKEVTKPNKKTYSGYHSVVEVLVEMVIRVPLIMK